MAVAMGCCGFGERADHHPLGLGSVVDRVHGGILRVWTTKYK